MIERISDERLVYITGKAVAKMDVDLLDFAHDLSHARIRIAELELKLDEVQRELRQERGLKALLANGMPPTGNPDFDEILATHPIAAMIQRGWLGGVTGFDDLPALESAICHFWRANTIAECVNPRFDAALKPVASAPPAPEGGPK